MIIKPTRGGLFSCLFKALNSIAWCEENEITPAIYWGPRCLYYQKEGYHGVTDNVWEYYFEPINSIKLTNVENNSEEQQKLRKKCRTSKHFLKIPRPYDENYDVILDQDYKKTIHALIKKYIKIKPFIHKKVTAFYFKNMNYKRVIGIHLRGTDKELEVKSVATPVSICEEANSIAAKMGGGFTFFVATDEESLLQTAKSLLKGPVICYPSYRSLNGKPIHIDKHSYSKALLGEEVLIEALLLSKCKYFIHTRSNVSTAVLLFNPELKNKILY